jgi:hypothetical protein
MSIKIKLSAISLILVLTIGYLPTPVGALGSSIPYSQFQNLAHGNTSKENESEQPSSLTQLHVDDLITLRIVQQPIGDSNFVTSLPNYVTEYQTASKYGAIGLLAHNYLAGQYFFQISLGQNIKLVYSDKRTASFVVTQIHQYQALSPNSPTSDFIDLYSGTYFSSSEIFKKNFGNQTGKLILQTCIYADQNPTWGRLFIIADPIS